MTYSVSKFILFDCKELNHFIMIGKVANGEGYQDDDFKLSNSETKLTITDAEANKQCIEWKNQYEVVIGKSWGNLPHDLQQKWLQYSCDYHLQD